MTSALRNKGLSDKFKITDLAGSTDSLTENSPDKMLVFKRPDSQHSRLSNKSNRSKYSTNKCQLLKSTLYEAIKKQGNVNKETIDEDRNMQILLLSESLSILARNSEFIQKQINDQFAELERAADCLLSSLDNFQ